MVIVDYTVRLVFLCRLPGLTLDACVLLPCLWFSENVAYV